MRSDPIRPAEQAQREYDEVVRQYTDADGSKRRGWMKAPNGKPTNLTERQWVQVRTPSFKRWFGDWEAIATRTKWHDVTDIRQFIDMTTQDVSGIPPLADKAAFKTAFAKWGRVENEEDKRMVVFPNTSAGKMIRTGSVSGALDKLFMKSRRAWSEDDDGRHPNIIGIHHYIAKAYTQEGEVFVHFTVREDNRNKNGVHAATVSSVEVYTKNAEITPGPNLTKSAREDTSAPFTDNNIAYFLREVNRESVSKVVDENGEPKVVRHYTNNKFTIFGEDKIRERHPLLD